MIKLFEDSTKLVSLVDIFSNNECFEEVTTENLKYFLLPALLGTLTTKICGHSNRLDIINAAEIYFVDFLQRLVSYKIIDIEIPELSNESKIKNYDANIELNAENIKKLVKFFFQLTSV